eukprot:TRINITY_DN79773_c0_g1_i1.p1 TRINITY_DN79773_c0_g1~~TRINITY_DN79773_c0_g1_i1.p1  ORF type:complete len:259 (+),score=23.08 TRINITY_DN79773_c0_g1_i1:190-966(+)
MDRKDYEPMSSLHRDASYDGGNHQALDPMLQVLEDRAQLIHSESMQLSNDPRFFQDNVLNKRLSAFSGLSVVSGLMVGTCSSVISMRKDVDLTTLEGHLQLLAFCLMSLALFLNILATYVGVAQIYHTYRLETAGPTGFEMAASYYLNPNIVAWRHLAVKCMLNSLPVFLISTGMRIAVNFDRMAMDTSGPSRFTARFLGFSFMCIYSLVGWLIYHVHQKHMAIFRDNYDTVKQRETSYLTHVRSMMSNKRTGRPLDV